MKLVIKIDGAWQAVPAGAPFNVTRQVATRLCIYQDGRSVQEACDPYPVDDTIDPGKIAALVADGTWTQADLDPYGLRLAEPFVAPDGRRSVGEPSYREENGTVLELYEVEEIPASPPPPTREERIGRLLDDYGLTLADLKGTDSLSATAKE